jgi:type I restriction enzyme S subunit
MIAEVPFSELLSVVIDNRGKTCPTADAGIPLIATNCIRNELLYPTYDKVRFVSKDTYSNWFRGHPLPGDIIFVNKATPGRVCLVPDPVDFCIAQDMVAVRANPKRVYPNYLFAVLRSPAVQEKIGQMHVGTLIPHFKKGDFDKLLLPIPEPEEQEFIGDTYFELSAKIDANRRMNATLEAMAGALFQSWFVDFDPVRAKLDGRKPVGLDPATAALFPASFQDSSIGHIPTGWEVAELGQIADVIDCLHAKKPERCENGQLYLQLNNIRDDGLIDITDSFFVSAEDYQKWISRMEARAGDCVITNVGRVGAVGQIPEGVMAALGRNITGIRCKSEFPFPTFLIECLVSESMREEIRLKTDSGTILDALNVKSIPKLRFVRPTWEIGARFESLTRPLRRRMEQNLSESRTLATLRDTLLPKLLSGELPIRPIA